MLKASAIALTAATLVLAACGGGSSHASCKDNYQTSDYMKKFGEDLVAAAASGKITKEAMEQSQMDLMRFSGDPDDVGALCTWADEQRKKLGI